MGDGGHVNVVIPTIDYVTWKFITSCFPDPLRPMKINMPKS